MKTIRGWLLGLLLSVIPGAAIAIKKIEIIELSNSTLINGDFPSKMLVISARKIEGVKLPRKLKNRLSRDGLKVRVNLPKQEGLKLQASPAKVKLAFDPATETFSSADVLVFPVQIDKN